MRKTYIQDTVTKVGEEIILQGWVHTRRDHGKLIFIDLRDSTGIVQVVFHPKVSEEVHKMGSTLSIEDVITLTGKVNARPENAINPDLPTGTVEIEATKIEIISKAQTPPIEINNPDIDVDETVRLKYRYLDLRRAKMQKNLRLRHQVSKLTRDFLDAKGYVEIETPYLSKTTPEGARDFLVPSRLQKGNFYALAQAPQQYKQLLMVAGFEKYYQLARAFRDEDLRSDRQFEHTQIDIEASFVERDDILGMVEELMTQIAQKTGKQILQSPFPRLTFQEAQEKYGADKFDLRAGDPKDPDTLAFAFVVDFPLFERVEAEKRWTFSHNPFTAPRPEDMDKLNDEGEIGDILSLQYDLVCNGYEIGSGSIRITDPRVQAKVLEIMGYSKADIQDQFGHLLDAYTYGAPTHGGIALGLDRLVALLAAEPSIREVIAFPVTSGGQTSVMDAPSPVSDQTLKDLGLKRA